MTKYLTLLEQTTAPKWRLNVCALDERLHRLARHQNGRCSTCNQRETITHFLMECITPLV
jgi:hypothetical protein